MTASTDKATARTKLLYAEPQLFTSDIKAATEFYTAKLGFEVRFIYGEPPFYAQVARDGARLNLRHADGPVYDAAFRAQEGDALSATIVLDDAQALYLEYQQSGAIFRQSLKTEPWGARTFIVEDPDHNLVLFAGSGP